MRLSMRMIVEKRLPCWRDDGFTSGASDGLQPVARRSSDITYVSAS